MNIIFNISVVVRPLQFLLLLFSILHKTNYSSVNAQACEAEVLFKRLNIDCVPTDNYLYCVFFEVEDKEDASGNILKHIWDLGDGSIKPGFSVEHCYNKYGYYKVKLISSKVLNGIVYHDTTIYPIDVGEVALIQEIKEDRFRYFFDGSSVYISEKFTIQNYYWDFGDGNFGCNMLEKNRYIKPGEYEVKLLVKGVAKDGGTRVICGSKKITVK